MEPVFVKVEENDDTILDKFSQLVSASTRLQYTSVSF